MRELIEKIEAATEGGRELDAEIARLQGLTVHDEHFVRVTSYDGYPEGALSPIPRYTTSLDAALSLVPEGCWWTMGSENDNDGPRGPWATIWRDIFVEANASAATPALALVAACLRAIDAADATRKSARR